MAGYTFVHFEAYGKVASKARTTKSPFTARQVVEEAMRETHACPHVASPEKPTIVYGVSAYEVLDMMEKASEGAVDAKGRKLRCDANILGTCVLSYPEPVEALKADPDKMTEYKVWRADALDWLKELWGDTLQSAVEHLDEPFPHLHCYGVAQKTADNRLELGPLHPGLTAKAAARRAKVLAGKENEAYKEAMRSVQDSYWSKVGVKHGQARVGPRKRRLSREAWRMEQVTHEKAAVSLKEAATIETSAKADVAALKANLEATKAAFTQEAKAEAATVLAAAKKDATAITQRAKKKSAKEVQGAQTLGHKLHVFLSYVKGQKVEELVKAEVERATQFLKTQLAEAGKKLEDANREKQKMKAQAENEKARAEQERRQVMFWKNRFESVTQERDQLANIIDIYRAEDAAKESPEQTQSRGYR